ncbi:MAG: DUF229 domain-containing protein [Spirobacillus cienkowskii]|jgi:hypothetical protein|uniref:DUF229 domain-containing protein n=1 Tax=Spirobacillus cienkowskii TaxID=495820 RepID=A0A369KWA0_9BACT|nr:MAG: DUF229 domain-containing protein [Spirobacillus cienkowskii]
MLTLKKRDKFFVKYTTGTLIFLLSFLSVTLFFSSKITYMDQDVSKIFIELSKYSPKLVISIVLKIIFIVLLCCFSLQILSFSLKNKYKFLFGLLFFLSLVIRMGTMYPGTTENFIIFNLFESLRSYIEYFSSLPEHSFIRILIEWFPFIMVFILFTVNLITLMKQLVIQSKLVKKAQSSILIEKLDYESQIFSFQGIHLIGFVIIGSIFLYQISSWFDTNIPENQTNQEQPHVFIFAIDSLRYDRVENSQYSYVMPFLHQFKKQADFVKPMIVGIPRTFPSWVEIATGNYASSTQIKHMFPNRSPRMSEAETVFKKAQDSGYNTLFVSDFAGDIFPRYLFGGSKIVAPTLNLTTLLENNIISFFAPLKSALILPNMQNIFSSILESPEIADPKLIFHTVTKLLKKYSKSPQPIFLTTFFSTAHFPYAVPGPWYSKFQNIKDNGEFIFIKKPDQNPITGEISSDSVPYLTKKKTIELYNGGLNCIDNTLKNIFYELKNKGWLTNSVILVFGDHGENLYDGSLGLGHGDGVGGEFSSVTPLIISLNGKTKVANFNKSNISIVRSIDIAPTISKRINLNFDYKNVDGVDIFDYNSFSNNFPANTAYTESGIWFTSGYLSPEGQARINYPKIFEILSIDEGFNNEFYLQSDYNQPISGVKERSWVNATYKLIARTDKNGVNLSLYLRSDKNSENNLLSNKFINDNYEKISLQMLNNMNAYLSSRGIEIVKNSKKTFFYSENINK